MSKHMIRRPINLIKDLPSQNGNHSQDDIDTAELNKFLAEFEKLSSNDATGWKNDLQADKRAIRSENSNHFLCNSKFIPTLTQFDVLGIKTKESKPDVRATASLNKLNQNQDVLNQKHFNLQPTFDSVDSNLKIPSQSQLTFKPNLVELINKSEAQVPISLSAPVNGATKPCAVPEKADNNAGQSASLSLADLANQYKSQRVKVGSPNGITSHKINADMPVLLSLEAQVSALKVCPIINSSCPLNNESPKRLNGQSSHLVSISSSTGLLDDLSKAHALKGNNSSTISLSNLVKQHKQSTQPFSPFENSQEISHKLLSPLFKNITHKDIKSTHEQTNHIPSVILSSSSLHSTTSAPDISLASCLKINRPSTTGSRQPLKPEQDSDTEESTVVDNTSYVGTVEHLASLHLQDNTTHTDLMAPPSDLGFVLCSFKWKGTHENAGLKSNRPLRYPKFKCSRQVGGKEMYAEKVYHKIEPFDFSTPSPDDIVKSKQKLAFTRPDKEFEL